MEDQNESKLFAKTGNEAPLKTKRTLRRRNRIVFSNGRSKRKQIICQDRK